MISVSADTIRISENVFYLTQEADRLLEDAPLNYDSQSLFRNILFWAKEFEDSNTDEDNYLSEILSFAETKVKEFIAQLQEDEPSL